MSTWKLGGWYFDIDTVILKSLDPFIDRNVLSTDQNCFSESTSQAIDPDSGLKMMGQTVANGVFHISHNESQLIYETMKNAQKTYEANNWASLGAIPLTQALRNICKIQQSEFAANFVTGGKWYFLHYCV